MWTFQHDEHVHFVLYQDADNIGYAHAQLWPNHKVALRIIVSMKINDTKILEEYFCSLLKHGLKR